MKYNIIDFGWIIYQASNSNDAIILVSQNRVDLVVIDECIDRKFTGPDLTHKLRTYGYSGIIVGTNKSVNTPNFSPLSKPKIDLN